MSLRTRDADLLCNQKRPNRGLLRITSAVNAKVVILYTLYAFFSADLKLPFLKETGNARRQLHWCQALGQRNSTTIAGLMRIVGSMRTAEVSEGMKRTLEQGHLDAEKMSLLDVEELDNKLA